MSEELNFLHNITGSFAQPAAENPTVEMVEAAYRHHGLHYRYLNTEVSPEKLADAVGGARAGGVRSRAAGAVSTLSSIYLLN